MTAVAAPPPATVDEVARNRVRRASRRRTVVAVLAVLVVAGIGVGYLYTAKHSGRPARTARPAAGVLRGRYAH